MYGALRKGKRLCLMGYVTRRTLAVVFNRSFMAARFFTFGLLSSSNESAAERMVNSGDD
jgi:hypothetical protein